ncbi:hypothetical protein V6N12_043138 [Hibiscus sabdariffa]|uniref:Uncharacterized protein n=1 Tax=Hibiscus sabdariffa TaxID=183260 RepID=A0ABR2DJH5_9ROSI
MGAARTRQQPISNGATRTVSLKGGDSRRTNRSGNPPLPPSRPPTVYGGGRRCFAATPIIDIPSSSESAPNAAPGPPPPNIRLDRRAPRSPTISHHSSDFMMPAQDEAGPSRPRLQISEPDSPTFYSMPTLSQSQSMPDAYSAHSYMPDQVDNPEVPFHPSFQTRRHNQAPRHPDHPILGILLHHLLLLVLMPRMIMTKVTITLGVEGDVHMLFRTTKSFKGTSTSIMRMPLSSEAFGIADFKFTLMPIWPMPRLPTCRPPPTMPKALRDDIFMIRHSGTNTDSSPTTIPDGTILPPFLVRLNSFSYGVCTPVRR